MHRWFTEAERRYQGQDWWEFGREGDRLRVLQKQIDGEYDDYCSDCIEFGVDPITKEQFISNDNYTEDELKLLYTPPDKHKAYMREYNRKQMQDPIKAEKKRTYCRNYARQHKEEIKAKRERRKKKKVD